MHCAYITMNISEKISLYETSADRSVWESLSDIYSIIRTLEFLEKAYLRDIISSEEYTPTCLRLLAQYKTILKSPSVANAFGSLETFCAAYEIPCFHAIYRLNVGVPVTIEHVTKSPSLPESGISAKQVAEAVQNFITFMDALRLKYTAKDQLHPLLSELMVSLNAVTHEMFEGRGTIVHWLILLNNMSASEEITEQQSRQMLFDVEGVYNEFYKSLSV
ncbi:hypothetical protein T552_01430 [Pneumocystis carinii B80]|uniref:Vacuolar protein sorting-associated protein 28 n=1 Tax=Pneumocystis carinii (strain B80) TaxID=1408658 RepID=A0A0W4ZK97_PNEC8|nr:hypothetical protein T552_01430 [Pneumocystis carinii B80]KTW28800.1 hypothetical protein T552_01430 [Pneumocystis carinii B80]